jgi:acyl-CoA dehydrogenase
MPLPEATPAPHYFTSAHQQFRDGLRDWVSKEITPHATAWDEAEGFPRELYRKAAAIGLLGMGYPEEYGGTPSDLFFQLVRGEELARSGAGGVSASLMSHTIGLPPVVRYGSAALKARVIPPVLAGDKIAALAVTEPSGGSDVAALRTTAVRGTDGDGDHYIVNGEKVFITSGMRADFITAAVRTDPSAKGANGISALLIEGDMPGLSRTKLDKMGWWASDTAHLRFDNVRVPAANLIGGREGQGFKMAMRVLDKGRIHIAAVCVGVARRMLADALAYAAERQQFGQAIGDFQLVQAMLADSETEIYAAECMVMDAARRRDDGRPVSTEAACCKLFASEMCGRVADRAVQIFGGAGYMAEYGIERFYRDVRIFRLYEGTSQIMQLVIGRNLMREQRQR